MSSNNGVGFENQKSENDRPILGIHATPTSSKLAEMLLTLKSTESITLLTPNDERLANESSRVGKVWKFSNFSMVVEMLVLKGARWRQGIWSKWWFKRELQLQEVSLPETVSICYLNLNFPTLTVMLQVLSMFCGEDSLQLNMPLCFLCQHWCPRQRRAPGGCHQGD